MRSFKKNPTFFTKRQSFLGKIASEIPFFGLLMFSLVICIGTILAVIFLKDHIPPQVPLFYGTVEGEDQLVPTLGLTIPNFLALIIIVINTILATIFENNFVRNSLVLTSFAVTLVATITTFKILLLVGSF